MAKSRLTDTPQDFQEPAATAAPAPIAPEKEPEPAISAPIPEPTPEPQIVEVPPATPTVPEPEVASAPEITPAPPVRTGPVCPVCGSAAIGIAGGMRRCNQCGDTRSA